VVWGVYRSPMGKRAREERRTIFLKARLRTDAGWSEVSIGNISSRGLMFRAQTPPPRGSFIEIRHRSTTIVGRVAWSHGSRCGVRTQDQIDIQGLLAPSPIRPRRPGEERRTLPRRPIQQPAPCIARRAEQSRRFSVIFNWSAIALAGTCAAFVVADVARTALVQPARLVAEALNQSNR
jgi:hypothetical protein